MKNDLQLFSSFFFGANSRRRRAQNGRNAFNNCKTFINFLWIMNQNPGNRAIFENFQWSFGSICRMQVLVRSRNHLEIETRSSCFHLCWWTGAEPKGNLFAHNNCRPRNLEHFNLFLNENKWWIFDVFFHLFTFFFISHSSEVDFVLLFYQLIKHFCNNPAIAHKLKVL